MTVRNPKEKDVKKKIKALLTKHGWFWFMPPANGFGKAGISDTLALRDGVFMAVEAKFLPNKPTPNQIGFLETVTANNGLAFCVNEQNILAFEAYLAAFDNAQDFTRKGLEVPVQIGSILLNTTKELTDPFVSPQVKKADRAMQLVKLKDA